MLRLSRLAVALRTGGNAKDGADIRSVGAVSHSTAAADCNLQSAGNKGRKMPLQETLFPTVGYAVVTGYSPTRDFASLRAQSC